MRWGSTSAPRRCGRSSSKRGPAHSAARRSRRIAHGVIERTLPGTGAAAWARLGAAASRRLPRSDVRSGERRRSGCGGRARARGRHRHRLHVVHDPADRSQRRGRLCLDPSGPRGPHAWVKLWKHHAAQPQADRINALGTRSGRAVPRRLRRDGLRRSGSCAKVAADPRGGPGRLRCGRRLRRGRRLGRLRADGHAGAQRVRGRIQRAAGAASAAFPSADVLRRAPSRACETCPTSCRARSCRRAGGSAGLTGEMAARLGLTPGTAVARGHHRRAQRGAGRDRGHARAHGDGDRHLHVPHAARRTPRGLSKASPAS